MGTILQALVIVVVGVNLYTAGLLWIVGTVGAWFGREIMHFNGAYVLESLLLMIYYTLLLGDTWLDSRDA